MVKEVLFIATLDARTTVICGSLDRKVFKLGEGPRPPIHIRCRSTITPVIPSFRDLGTKLGIKLNDLPESTRASMNGQVPGSTKVPQWLNGQTVSVQDKVLGKSRAQLWRAGKVSYDSFVDSRAGFRPLSLTELRKAEGIAPPAPKAKPKPKSVPQRTGLERGGEVRKMVLKLDDRLDVFRKVRGETPTGIVKEFGSLSKASKSASARLDKAQAQLSRLLSRQNRSAHRMMATPESLRPSFSVRGMSPGTKAKQIAKDAVKGVALRQNARVRFDEGARFVARMSTRHDLSDDMRVELVIRKKGGRAFARPEIGAIAVPHNSGVATWVHELGHSVELGFATPGSSKKLLIEAKAS